MNESAFPPMRASTWRHTVLAVFVCFQAHAATPGKWDAPGPPVRMTHPGSDCPAPGKNIPQGAREAMARFLGPEAIPLCLGDLNGNGRPELLAAIVTRTYGEGLGFYRVTQKSGIFEAGANGAEGWRAVLLTSDRVENQRGLVGWQRPVEEDGIGLRYTMTHGKGICVQLRRLDFPHACTEEPLILIRWDPVVERYEPGPCASGTAGPAIPVPPKKP